MVYTNRKEFEDRIRAAYQQRMEAQNNPNSEQPKNNDKYDINFVQCGVCIEYFAFYELNENLTCERCANGE